MNIFCVVALADCFAFEAAVCHSLNCVAKLNSSEFRKKGFEWQTKGKIEWKIVIVFDTRVCMWRKSMCFFPLLA